MGYEIPRESGDMSRWVEMEVLGCHGGEMAGFLTPSLLIDKSIMLDAGSFSYSMSFEQQLAVDHVIVSHAHCDHVKDLAMFADLIIGHRKKPVHIYASAGAMQVIRNDMFNNRLWPDFFSLPNPENPVLKQVVFPLERSFRVGPLSVRAVAVSHSVESVGFLIRSPSGGTFVYTGDTGPTEQLWRMANRLKDLKLVLIETKFPNDLQVVADAAGHLTPKTLEQELKKIRAKDVQIGVYHLKPDRFELLLEEIEALADSRLSIVKIGDRYRF